MADRVSASITIGGALSAADYATLAALIAGEGLSIEWDGPRFEPAHRTLNTPLQLYAHEIAWGRFEALEAWCVEHKLAFARWCGGYASQWGAERCVFSGDGEPVSYPADEDDYVVIGRDKAAALGSIEAILAYFDAADVEIPPLVVKGDPLAAPRVASTAPHA